MRRVLREWRVEITLVALLGLGLFLLLERLDIRITLWRWLDQAALVAGDAVLSFMRTFLPNTLSDWIGVVMIAGVLLLARWRLRWRLLRSPSFSSQACPRCGSHLHRIHRKPYDRAIETLIVPVRRYLCSNSACRWSGLRVEGRKLKRKQPGETMSSETSAGGSNL